MLFLERDNRRGNHTSISVSNISAPSVQTFRRNQFSTALGIQVQLKASFLAQLNCIFSVAEQCYS